MGRTNPTYRDAIERLEADCRPFRRALRRQYQDDFDRLFDRARNYADAAGYYNGTDPEFAFVLSVLLAQEVELRELRERVDERERERPSESESERASESESGRASESESGRESEDG